MNTGQTTGATTGAPILPRLLLSGVLDLRPIRRMIELRAVVQVVALFTTAGVLHQLAKLLAERDILAPLGRGMGGAGPWQFSQPFPFRCGVSSRLVKPVSKGTNSCGFQPVAWQLMHSGSNCRGGSSLTSVSVACAWGVLSQIFVSRLVALAAGFAADEPRVGIARFFGPRIHGRLQAQAGPAQVSQLPFVGRHQRTHFRCVDEARIDRHPLVARSAPSLRRRSRAPRRTSPCGRLQSTRCRFLECGAAHAAVRPHPGP